MARSGAEFPVQPAITFVLIQSQVTAIGFVFHIIVRHWVNREV